MKQHKWHKEIKAWADGVEIEFKVNGEGDWALLKGTPYWECKNDLFRIKPQPKEPNIECNCYGDGNVYRGTRSSDSTIKTYTYPQDWLNQNPITQPKEPQPIPSYKGDPTPTHVKEPQYLYVYLDDDNRCAFTTETFNEEDIAWEYIGKIKLEVEE